MVAGLLAKTEGDSGNRERLRLWIRMLRASRVVENALRERLKREFDTTLPRFDVLATLSRQPEGMLMSDLSRFLLVSNGNVTGIVSRLAEDGLVARAQREGDRRTSIVRLTSRGEAEFRRMAAVHESWIGELFADIGEDEARHLSTVLNTFRSNWEAEA